MSWEQEGRPGGRDLDHWLQAEAQLQQNRRQDAPEKQADVAMETNRNPTRPASKGARPRWKPLMAAVSEHDEATNMRVGAT
jgi:hypothetical protein